MNLIPKPGSFLPEWNDLGGNMVIVLLSVGSDHAYILDDEGFKAKFGGVSH